MKIAGFNLDIVWKNPKENFLRIENEIKNIEAEVILLPEMFSTGFCMEANEIADRNQETLQWLIQTAKKYNKAIAGGVSVSENNKFYNRFYFVTPSGDFSFYDKKHLFSYSGEDKIYTAGQERVVVEYLGVRFLLQICYDVRFPIFARNKKDYDVALYIANFPQPRVDAWRTLLKARAIENQAYVFGLNRIGTDGNNLYYEESSDCYFADGTIISEKQDNWVIANLDMDKLTQFRNRYRFLDDADIEP